MVLRSGVIFLLGTIIQILTIPLIQYFYPTLNSNKERVGKYID